MRAVIAQSVECTTEKPGAILTWVRVPGVANKKKFLLGQLSVQTLLRCPYSPRVQSHASTPVCTLKIPPKLAAIPLFGHTSILHSLIGMGRAVLVPANVVPYPGKATRTKQ